MTMSWVVVVAAVLTALYGWFLFVQLAKNRQAHDLYCSVIALLQQIEENGIAAWRNGKKSLDQYTELKLTSKISDVEQRLALIGKYYDTKQKDEGNKITSGEISALRACITQTADRIPSEEDRRIDIHRLTSDMIRKLLQENYTHINQRFWLPECMRK